MPLLSRSLLTARNITFTPVSRNAPEPGQQSEFSHFYRLEHLVNESVPPAQESLIEEIPDSDVVHLPIVIKAGKNWQVPTPGLTLPRRDRPESGQASLPAWRYSDHVYNTYAFPSVPHLKRFHKEVSSLLTGRFRTVDPVLLLEPRTRTLTIGLPAYIGIEPPFPAKTNLNKIRKLLKEYRHYKSSNQTKRLAMKELRSHIVPLGFKHSYHSLSLALPTLYEKVRTASEEQIFDSSYDFIEENGKQGRAPVQVGSDSTKKIAQRASKARKDGSEKEGKSSARKGSVKQKQQITLADRLKTADGTALPEAEVFVAQDGGAREPSQGVDSLKEHVPFPTPSPQEMGIEKPTGPESLDADDPKLPEAGIFVAQDGDKHKDSKGVDSLQENVPFPVPTAEEMGIKKPTET